MDKTEVYEPNKYLKLGISTWPVMFREMFHARELVWRLFLRNFSARYRQSLLGFVWAGIVPLMAIGTFLMLKKTGVVGMGTTAAPYPVFALAGLAVYQLFSSGLSAGCSALTEAGDMIAKVDFPREVLVLSSVGNTVVEFLIKAVLLAAVCVCWGYCPSPLSFLFLPAVVPMLLLTVGCSFFLSLANAVVRDTAQVVGLGSMFLMFLTPVLYPMPLSGKLFFQLNPLTALVEGPRDLFIYGFLRDPQGYIVACVIAVLTFMAGWRVFHLVETKIPERL